MKLIPSIENGEATGEAEKGEEGEEKGEEGQEKGEEGEGYVQA